VIPKRFENKARREWWSIHVEAWHRSGLGIRKILPPTSSRREHVPALVERAPDAKALQTQAELLRKK
jgi:hypothetical protein